MRYARPMPAPQNSGRNSGNPLNPREALSESSRGLIVREACCPECGSVDVNLGFSASPLVDGVQCWDCRHVYQLIDSGTPA